MDGLTRDFITKELRDRFDFTDELSISRESFPRSDREEFFLAAEIGAVLYHMINPDLNRSAKEVILCLKKTKIPKKCDIERAASHLVLKHAVSRACGLMIAESQAESIEERISELSEIYKRPKIQEYMKKYVPISFEIAEKLKYDITVKEFQKFVRLSFNDAMYFLKSSMYVQVNSDE